MAEPNNEVGGGLPQLKQLMDKSFWTRPEGGVGRWALRAMLLVALLAVGYNLGPILDYILHITETTLQIIWNVGLVGLIAYLATNERVHALVGAGFRAAMRSITGFFVDLAPVAVARDYIQHSKQELAKAQKAVATFRARMGVVIEALKTFVKKLADTELLAKNLEKQNKHEEAVAMQIKAERTRKRVESLQEMRNKMETLLRALDKMLLKAGLKIKNTEDEFEDQIKMYEVSLDAREAIAAVKAGVGVAGTTREEMKNMAAAKMALEISRAVVEIDDTIRLGDEIFGDVDDQEAILTQKALDRFETWQKESGNILGPGEKALIAEAASNPNVAYDLNAPMAPVSELTKGVSTDDFFRSK